MKLIVGLFFVFFVVNAYSQGSQTKEIVIYSVSFDVMARPPLDSASIKNFSLSKKKVIRKARIMKRIQNEINGLTFFEEGNKCDLDLRVYAELVLGNGTSKFISIGNTELINIGSHCYNRNRRLIRLLR